MITLGGLLKDLGLHDDVLMEAALPVVGGCVLVALACEGEGVEEVLLCLLMVLSLLGVVSCGCLVNHRFFLMTCATESGPHLCIFCWMALLLMWSRGGCRCSYDLFVDVLLWLLRVLFLLLWVCC